MRTRINKRNNSSRYFPGIGIVAAVIFQSLEILAAVAGSKADDLPIGIDDLSYEQAVAKLAIPFRRDLPQLFVSGDSISVGYGPALKLALKDRMNVVHRRDVPTQFPAVASKNYSGAGPSLIQLTRAMLSQPDYKPDVLLLNFGLHAVAGGVKAYEQDLAALLALVQQHQVKLIWVQTTSKAAGRPENPRIAEFNAIASRLMAAAKMPAIDLPAFTAQLIEKHGQAKIIRPDQVHFTAFASAEQGRFIAQEVEKLVADAANIESRYTGKNRSNETTK